ncbi:proliferating cell nuclear antigen (pcna) [Candidatus Woesearchaeota archaeon]|nr:proliferating cell nuclear antigen (pcna) [Candidatus Woesearchaeota archaeon]
MKLTLTDNRLLKDSITVISDLVTEGQFKITKKGMELVAMDPANVAMVIFKLHASAFSELDLDEPTTIAINIGNLKQVLRRVKPEDSITLELVDDRLKVELRSKTKREYKLPLIEMEEREQRIPDLDFPVIIRTQASVLNDAVEDVEIIAESVAFWADSKSFEVRARSDLSTANVTIDKDAETEIINESKGEVLAKYSIEYLKRMIAGSKISSQVTIQFNNDYPLKLEYSTPEKVDISFILAPRVEND